MAKKSLLGRDYNNISGGMGWVYCYSVSEILFFRLSDIQV